MKRIKLINDEKKLVSKSSVKACSEIDNCIAVDAAVCDVRDICKYDYASCVGNTNDYCSGYDLVSDNIQ